MHFKLILLWIVFFLFTVAHFFLLGQLHTRSNCCINMYYCFHFVSFLNNCTSYLYYSTTESPKQFVWWILFSFLPFNFFPPNQLITQNYSFQKGSSSDIYKKDLFSRSKQASESKCHWRQQKWEEENGGKQRGGEVEVCVWMISKVHAKLLWSP